MGDRGNITIKPSYHSDKPIYLYSHWDGYRLPEIVKEALSKRWRWDDDQYLARIIFDVMTDGHHGEESGYGISAYPGEGSRSDPVVDCANQTVIISGVSQTFEEFIQ